MKSHPPIVWSVPRASHFICARRCRFGLTSWIPGRPYVVSSVGDMREGEGQAEPIGHERLYETMVFRWDGRACNDPNCGFDHCQGDGGPIVSDFANIDMLGANSRCECVRNHFELVRKWLVSKGPKR